MRLSGPALGGGLTRGVPWTDVSALGGSAGALSHGSGTGESMGSGGAMEERNLPTTRAEKGGPTEPCPVRATKRCRNARHGRRRRSTVEHEPHRKRQHHAVVTCAEPVRATVMADAEDGLSLSENGERFANFVAGPDAQGHLDVASAG